MGLSLLDNLKIAAAAVGLDPATADALYGFAQSLGEMTGDHVAQVIARNRAQECEALIDVAATLTDLAELEDPPVGREDLRGLAARLVFEVERKLAPDLAEDADEGSDDPGDSSPPNAAA